MLSEESFVASLFPDNCRAFARSHELFNHFFVQFTADSRFVRRVEETVFIPGRVYREVDATIPGSGLALLKECLTELIQTKIIRQLPVDALAHLLSGAMDEAAL